jgi:hypothetical protein
MSIVLSSPFLTQAPVAAAQAAQELKFGHWVQSSTQATRADRAGQVMYSRAKVPPSLRPLVRCRGGCV